MKENPLFYSLIGSVITAAVALLGKKFEWWRFAKKDEAETAKIDAEREAKLSTAALEWTVQLAGQLEKANLVIDKRQVEIEKLHETIDTMKREFAIVVDGFNKRIRELESALDTTMDELQQERLINQEEMEKIRNKNGTK